MLHRLHDRIHLINKSQNVDHQANDNQKHLAFQMEEYNNMFFTIWYGVYDKETRQILYSSGGHPPAILITGESAEKAQVHELKTPGIVIGAIPEGKFENAVCQVERFNRLYVYSDGVYEIKRVNGSMLTLKEFIDLLTKTPRKEGFELDYLVQFTQNIQGKTLFVDDFSLLQIIFA